MAISPLYLFVAGCRNEASRAAEYSGALESAGPELARGAFLARDYTNRDRPFGFWGVLMGPGRFAFAFVQQRHGLCATASYASAKTKNTRNTDITFVLEVKSQDGGTQGISLAPLNPCLYFEPYGPILARPSI